jgi:cyclic pyranopterin phosphate synthase
MTLCDTFSRSISYLRLSLTDTCPMGCVYCRPESGGPPAAAAPLTADEIDRLLGRLVQRHGLAKLRLTGGEPTARPDLLEIIARARRMPGLREVTLTTNGLTLARHASALAAAGLHRVNISLDSLDRQTFQRITGTDGLPAVLEGIDAALAAGLTPVKLNCVVLRGLNDGELCQLLRFAAGRGLEIRFIELMPMGPLAGQWAEHYVSEDDMRRQLVAAVRQWRALPRDRAPARRYRVQLDEGTPGTVGLITAISRNFCADCNRIRIACDGTWYPCLMGRPAGSLLAALRPRLDASELDRLLAEGLARKAEVHPAAGQAVMVRIGG